MRTKRHLLTIFFMGVLVVMLILGGCSSNQGQTTKEAPAKSEGNAETAKPVALKLGHSEGVNGVYHPSAIKLAGLADEKTGGRVKIEVYPASQLGSERELLEGMRMGTVDLTILNAPIYSSIEPKFQIFDLPYIFTSREEAYAALDGDLGNNLLKELEKYDIVGLGWGESGFRSFINSKKPLNKPSDIENMKFRAMETPVFIEMYKQFGGIVTAMPITDVYPALEQGVIDGLDISLTGMYSLNFYEVAKFISLTEHAYTPVVYAISKKSWDKLSSDDQKMLRQSIKEAVAFQRQYATDSADKIVADMEKAGAKVNKVEDKLAFRQKLQPLYDKFKPSIGEELVDSLIK